MIDYECKNVNPKGKKTGDCVVRALSLAMNMDYVEVYKALFELSLKTGYIVNDKRVEEKFLAQCGFVKHKQPKKPSGKKYLVGEFDKLCREIVIVVSCAHHLTVVLNGVLTDSWDCRGKCISNYYTKG